MPDSTDRSAEWRAEFDLTDRGAYTFWNRDIFRWGDTDGMGHINNVQFARFFESGRIAYLGACAPGRVLPADDFMIVHLSIDFRAQMHYPGEVMIGTRALRIGRTSMRVGQGLFQDDRCTATGEGVVVMVDPETDRPTPIPKPIRQRLLDPLA